MIWARWDIPEIQWLGVQKIVFWIVDLPASLALAAGAVGLFWVAIWMTHE